MMRRVTHLCTFAVLTVCSQRATTTLPLNTHTGSTIPFDTDTGPTTPVDTDTGLTTPVDRGNGSEASAIYADWLGIGDAMVEGNISSASNHSKWFPVAPRSVCGHFGACGACLLVSHCKWCAIGETRTCRKSCLQTEKPLYYCPPSGAASLIVRQVILLVLTMVSFF
eukprot:Gregarina_sp_Poly_1__1574@NODE_139_length_13109_cov_53_487809_g124_i0_p12_GENE_NODE_139_length_13109_cov_53_487809_g124_i0NODE_139_length_13109_cov_53_487809_g124_i0_p12_ORF_typecomplete_len167_score2_18Defensin_beta_2/PF13841_6/7_9e03Defensin_beta_2/PF13841_6/0_00014PSI/PF01437_25/0_11PSI_integrin/PF17205_3/1_8e04PSI_integrin/PF17205_3/1_9_NODE_139_length_13109_cov_53_487809_g124_i040884588